MDNLGDFHNQPCDSVSVFALFVDLQRFGRNDGLRGLSAIHASILRRVQHYASEFDEQRRVKNLNIIVEYAHRFINHRIKPESGFCSCQTVWQRIRRLQDDEHNQKGPNCWADKGGIRTKTRIDFCGRTSIGVNWDLVDPTARPG